MQKLNLKLCLFCILIFLMAINGFGQEKRRIAILPFTNNGGAESNWVARGIEEIVYDKLSNLSHMQVFEKETFDRILRSNNILDRAPH